MSKQRDTNQPDKAKKILMLVVVVLFISQVYSQKINESRERQLHNSTVQPLNNSLKRSPSIGLRGANMHFTPNQGQVADINGNLCPDILYKGDGGGSDVYLRKNGISYVYSNISQVSKEVSEQVEGLIKSRKISEGKGEETKFN